jgi:predicted transcriptional regulator
MKNSRFSGFWPILSGFVIQILLPPNADHSPEIVQTLLIRYSKKYDKAKDRDLRKWVWATLLSEKALV